MSAQQPAPTSSRPRPRGPRRAHVLVLLAALTLGLLGAAPAARADEPPVVPPIVVPPVLPPVVPQVPTGLPTLLPGSDPWPSYEPQTTCATAVLPGTLALQAWAVRTYGGRRGGTLRGCDVGARSEHKDGRAFDWTMNARKRRDRLRVKRFIAALVAPDAAGQPAGLARRAGVMYVIWRDRMYASWNGYAPTPYLHAACTELATCSRTLRHRDHVHVSLSRAGAAGLTTFYVGRI